MTGRVLKEAARRDPKCAYWLANFVRRFQTDLLDGVSQLAPEKAAEFQQMGREYAELWRAGKIGSPEMLALAQKMRDLPGNEGLLSLDDPDLLGELENPSKSASSFCRRSIAIRNSSRHPGDHGRRGQTRQEELTE